MVTRGGTGCELRHGGLWVTWRARTSAFIIPVTGKHEAGITQDNTTFAMMVWQAPERTGVEADQGEHLGAHAY